MELVQKLQKEVAPTVFTPPAVYDGRKNMFAARLLPLGGTHAGTVSDRCPLFNSSLHYTVRCYSFTPGSYWQTTQSLPGQDYESG
jgi:hypothetical protein